MESAAPAQPTVSSLMAPANRDLARMLSNLKASRTDPFRPPVLRSTQHFNALHVLDVSSIQIVTRLKGSSGISAVFIRPFLLNSFQISPK